jgi:hypothetical protein
MPIRFDVLVLCWCAVAFFRDVGALPSRPAQVLSGIFVGLMLFVVLMTSGPLLR